MKNLRDQKVRVTISMFSAVCRELDRHADGAEMNRSQAVEQAVTEWVRRHVEQDQERISGLSKKMDEVGRKLDARMRLSAQELIEALRYQFPGTVGAFSSEELERRARAELRRRNGSNAKWRD